MNFHETPTAIDIIAQAIYFIDIGQGADFYSGFQLIFNLETLLIIFVGVIIGIIFAAIPGLGASAALAITLPFTFTLSPANAIILLLVIYNGSLYGSSVTAVLLNVPGTASAAATTFDGYPMAKKGRALDALSASAVASAFGGFSTVVTVILFLPIISQVVLLFNSPERFLIAVLGLAMIVVITKGRMLKGLAAGFFGMAISTIGSAGMAPVTRYTFGNMSLYDGLEFVAILIGVFAIAEMLNLSKRESISSEPVELSGSNAEGFKSVFRHWITLLKSSHIGLVVGSLPGAGATVSNFIAYSESARSSAKDKISFGDGNVKGVIASEASNNGTAAGSIIPTLAFGIPGSSANAVLLGGLVMHGIRPGPDLFSDEIVLTYSFYASMIVSNLVILVLGVSVIAYLAYITTIDTEYIIPTVIVVSVLGVLTLRSNWVDIWTLLFFGIVGYFMVKFSYSIVALVLGVILGPIAEINLYRSMQLSGGDWIIFVQTPLRAALVALILFVLIGNPLRGILHAIRQRFLPMW